MFKALAFGILDLVPNKIDFVLSWSKCILNLLSTNQSRRLVRVLQAVTGPFMPLAVGCCWLL